MDDLERYTFIKWIDDDSPTKCEYKQDMLLLHLDEEFSHLLTYTNKSNLDFFNDHILYHTIMFSHQEFLKKAIELYKNGQQDQQDQQDEKKYTINEIINIIQNHEKKSDNK
jgi:hypothetical protein